MNVTNALQTGLIGLNRGLDNNPRAAGDIQGVGRPEVAELASGRELPSDVQDTTQNAADPVSATKVVTSVDQVLGGNIDVHV